jgi:hypothetical protein
MVRTSTEGFAKYGFWLAGYYEDFQGLKCVADDTNTPSSDGAYDTNNTHHGNTMNGEATLNPRFRWSIRDRVTNNEFASSDSYLLSNKGIATWATCDTIRLSLGEKYEGKPRPQFPSGWAQPNRLRYDKAQTASTDDTYMLLSSGNDSAIKYYVPLGDTDATFGRKAKYAFNPINWYNGDVGIQTSGNDPHFMQTAHLTGVFMGERAQMFAYNSLGVAQTYADHPERLWLPIKSPAGKDFLNITTYMKQYNDNRLDNTTPTGADRPAISCSASLNSRGDGEYFTIRMATQAYNGFNNAPTPGQTENQESNIGGSLFYVLKIGFPTNTAFGTAGSNGGTAAIEWTFDPVAATEGLASGESDYHTIYDGGAPVLNRVNDATTRWFDLDFKLDYTNNKFKVYHDGVEVTSANTTAGAYSSGYTLKNDTSTSAPFLPKNMTGWEIFARTSAPTISEGAVIHTMIDRAALYIPLTNPPDGTSLPPPVKKWSCNAGVNSSSIGDIQILDDDSEHDMTKFFLDDEVLDWKLLMFSGAIDRPLWQGIIDTVKIKQNANDQTRMITITAQDSLGLMDRQIASWEIGQIGLGDSDVVLSRKNEVDDIANAMYLGTAKLVASEDTIGFESDTNYQELHRQRTVRKSAHPIQIYNNEDENGPNNTENEWLGSEVIGFSKSVSSSFDIVVKYSGHGLSNGDSITVYGTEDFKGDYTLQASGGVTSFTGGFVKLTPTTGTLTFTTSANLVQLKNENPDGVATSSIGFLKFSDRPSRADGTYLKVGDYIIIPETNSVAGNRGAHLVISTETKNGFYWVKTDGSLTTQTSGTTVDYCIEKGFVRPSSESIDNRNNHAVWMRDLTQSRWFRKHFGVYGLEPDNNSGTTYTISANVAVGDTRIQVDEAFFDAGGSDWLLKSGVGQIIDSDGFIDTFTYLGAVIDDVDGNDYLVGVEGLSRSHSSGATIESMSVSDDFKHCWVLWTDMRNDGNASADGGFRKNQFGLIQPVRDNYEIDISFIDQFDEQGNYDSFTDLKIGSELDLWEIDSENDPSTGVKWSMPLEDRTTEVRQTRNASGYTISNSSGKAVLHASATASLGVSGLSAGDYIYIFNNATYEGLHQINSISTNDITLETDIITQVTYDASNPNNPYFLKVVGSSDHDTNVASLADWESRGGSFVVIDASKFFNLNTYINGGRSGQESGGKVTIGDYETSYHGFPILMDSYWKNATATSKNIASPFGTHENQKYLQTEVAELNRTVLIGDTVIETKPSTSLIADFLDFGFGKIKATRGNDSQTASTEIFWYAYGAKLDTGVVESATSATVVGASPFTITCSGADFVNDGVKVGMRVRNVTAKWVAQITAVTATTITITEANIYQETGSTRTDVQISDSISIPQQLYDCFVFSDSATGFTPEEAENYLYSIKHDPRMDDGSTANIAVNQPNQKGTTGAFDQVIIQSTVSSQFALRFLMKMKGFVESPANGTYWLNDKMRFMWSMVLSSTWLSQSAIPCWYDIGSIPNYYNMTTDGTSANWDSFGSVVDARGSKTLFQIMRESVESTGFGNSNGRRLPITYQIGKDNKLEIRPSYNLGEALTRDSVKISSINASLGDHITNVRVFYNNGASFVDYPEPTLNQTYRWKILELPEATSRNEALSLAQEEYNKAKTKNLRLNCDILRDTTFNDKMLELGRTGYVADVARHVERGITAQTVVSGSAPAPTQYKNYTWSSPQSGSLFWGKSNALDGNMKYSSEIYKRDRYGKGYETEPSGSGDSNTYDIQYYWWGANSISNAVQMVHVPTQCPLKSDTTSEDLRIFIALKDGQSGTDIDEAEFTIYISDIDFNDSPQTPFLSPVTGVDTVSYAPSMAVSSSSTISLNVKRSGFYDIDIPSSYWSSKPAGAKFVISVDCDYLRAILRRRCGDPTASGILHNAHDIGLTGISNFANTSANSLFPLGVRQYDNMSGAYDTRNYWYAPRIHIVHDLRWRPATSVTVTDSGYNLSSEPMVIKNIDWAIEGRNIESVNLTLERDETKSAGGLSSYLFPSVSKNRSGSVGGTASKGGSSGANKGKLGDLDAGSFPPNQSGGGYTGGTSGGLGNTAFTPALYQGGMGSGLGNGSFSPTLTSNAFSPSAYSNLSGRMNMGDGGDSETQWGILGQNKPPIPQNTQRSIDGLDTSIKPSSATAVTSNEGFVLPGIVDPDTSNRYTHTQTINVRVPDDVADEMISVDCNYSVGGTVSDTAVLDVTVKCLETGSTLSRVVNISGNKDKKNMNLIGTSPLSGVGVKNNNIKITIERTAGSGDDDANFSSVVIHSVKVTFQRFSTKGRSNNAFKTY